jgi:ABC-2 type transport system ATP-binding protein
VRADGVDRLARLVEGAGATVSLDGAVLTVNGLSTDVIGTQAARAGITLFELSPQSASLEEAYLALTRDTVDYRADGPPRPSQDHDDRLVSDGAR